MVHVDRAAVSALVLHVATGALANVRVEGGGRFCQQLRRGGRVAGDAGRRFDSSIRRVAALALRVQERVRGNAVDPERYICSGSSTAAAAPSTASTK
jgi:hypothetical protein